MWVSLGCWASSFFGDTFASHDTSCRSGVFQVFDRHSFSVPPCLLFHFWLRECEGSDWFPRSFTFGNGKGVISIRLTNLLILH